MVQFVHPAKDDITLEGILAALADPMRLRILQSLLREEGCSCCHATPAPDMAKSTLSNHFRILREAGLIRTIKRGVENRNTTRVDEIEERFPDLLKTIIQLANRPGKQAADDQEAVRPVV
jgi:DNA-binding transcriptional ArsR family regulator